MKTDLAIFEGKGIRRIYDETTGMWFFSVVDIIQVLTQQENYKAARNYWKVLKNRLAKEGSESVTKCNQLKMPAADGKSCLQFQARQTRTPRTRSQDWKARRYGRKLPAAIPDKKNPGSGKPPPRGMTPGGPHFQKNISGPRSPKP